MDFRLLLYYNVKHRYCFTEIGLLNRAWHGGYSQWEVKCIVILKILIR